MWPGGSAEGSFVTRTEGLAVCEARLDVTADEMLPLVYKELRSLANKWLRQKQSGQTLQPTALVHEAYLRLARQPDSTWRNRGHFLAAATRAMRQVLIDHVRYRRAGKRGQMWKRITLSQLAARAEGVNVDLLALDEALSELAKLSERQCRIAELRFLAGLTIEETARLLQVCEKTVGLEWRMARAWLLNRLEI